MKFSYQCYVKLRCVEQEICRAIMVNLMKEEDFENYTDPILEECYRIKEELSAQFNSVEELSAYMRKIQEECRRKGMKVVSYYVPPEKREQTEAPDDGEN